ncbi:MAG: hypothetical protein KDJ77_18495 [Rhodobiaceae bacterium]|nr:hypothetical protein [Rhodobiaceae bacterium]
MRQAVDFEEDHSSERYQEFLLWFMRTLGLVFLVAGLVYWKPLVGLVDSPDRAFLALSRPDQVTVLIFAVLMPVTAIGLWFGASWGVGLIAISLIVRLAMAFGFPQFFEPDWVVLGGHVTIIVVYIVLRFMIYRHR